MLGDVGRCLAMLGDVGRCWAMLGDVRRCWAMLLLLLLLYLFIVQYPMYIYNTSSVD